MLAPESPAKIQEDIFPPPAGVAQVLSPLRKVVPLAVPVAFKSASNIGFAAVPVFAKSTKVLNVLSIVIEATPEPVQSISTHAVPFQKYIKFVVEL